MKVKGIGILILVVALVASLALSSHAEAFFNKGLKDRIAALENQLALEKKMNQRTIEQLTQDLETSKKNAAEAAKQGAEIQQQMTSLTAKSAQQQETIAALEGKNAGYDALAQKYQDSLKKIAALEKQQTGAAAQPEQSLPQDQPATSGAAVTSDTVEVAESQS